MTPLRPSGRGDARLGRGSRTGVASRSRPAAAIAVRVLVTAASRPHSAVAAAMATLLVTDHADRVRATRLALSDSQVPPEGKAVVR